MQTSLFNWYHQQVAEKLIIADSNQLEVIALFDKFILAFSQTHRNFFTRIFKPMHSSYRHGFYIYGEVGRGKSMLINALYEYLPSKHKTRLHFHVFMQQIQQQLSALSQQQDPLNQVARNLGAKYKIIFLDEMHVSDIASAMILKNLLLSLFKHKIFLVMSSNFAPKDLYSDGLMRSRFIPAINLLNQELNVIEMSGNHDYRFKNEANNQLFQLNTLDADNQLAAIFAHISNGHSVSVNSFITIQQRQLHYLQRSDNIIWFDFTYICGNGRSQLDYIELVTHFDWFIIQGIFALKPDQQDLARRFTLLIDILYDNHKKLALSASCAITAIYNSGEFSNEFARTISRLQEMQTKEYLRRPASNAITDT